MSFKRHIPNFLTVSNLLCGCAAIFSSFQLRFIDAILLILVAAIFDFFDGFVARLLKVKSDIGKELDSLADVVTFGVAPFFFVLMFLFSESNYLLFNDFVVNNWWVLVLFLVPSMSAIRLAKFNVDERQTLGFIGLPTPAHTIFLCSLPFVFQKLQVDITITSLSISLIAVISSLLMVSEVRLISLKFASFSFKENISKFLLLVLSAGTLLLCLFFDFLALTFPIIILLYLIISFIENTKKNDVQSRD